MQLRNISRLQLVRAGALAVGLLGSLDAMAAGTFSNVAITSIQVRSNGMVYINTSAASTGGPACTGSPTYTTFDGTTDAGKSLLTVANAAYMSGKRVDLVGTGSCLASYEGLARLTFRL